MFFGLVFSNSVQLAFGFPSVHGAQESVPTSVSPPNLGTSGLKGVLPPLSPSRGASASCSGSLSARRLRGLNMFHSLVVGTCVSLLHMNSLAMNSTPSGSLEFFRKDVERADGSQFDLTLIVIAVANSLQRRITLRRFEVVGSFPARKRRVRLGWAH